MLMKRKKPFKTSNEFVRRAYDCLERFNWTRAGMDQYIKARLLQETEEIVVRGKFEEGKKIGIEKESTLR